MKQLNSNVIRRAAVSGSAPQLLKELRDTAKQSGIEVIDQFCSALSGKAANAKLTWGESFTFGIGKPTAEALYAFGTWCKRQKIRIDGVTNSPGKAVFTVVLPQPESAAELRAQLDEQVGKLLDDVLRTFAVEAAPTPVTSPKSRKGSVTTANQAPATA